jgi:energy-coupling factor transport system permease protein
VTTRASGYFLPGDDWLHRRNPATKLLMFVAVLLAAFVLPPAILVVLLILVAVAAVTAGMLGPLLRSLRIPAVLIASILIVNAFFLPGAPTVIASLGPVHLTAEGILFGLTTAGRVLVAFCASILFLLTTLPDDLLEALVARGASHRIAFVVLSAVQLVPQLQHRAASILDAQQARGLSVQGSLLKRIRALVPLVGPILLGSLIDVRERTFALEARAFGSGRPRTAYRIVPDPPADRIVRWLTLLAMLGILAAAVLGLGR